MSPASILIKQFRLNRQLQQRLASEKLGYEQSFLSAIENGVKDIPKKEFIPKLIKIYDLNEEEQKILFEAIENSNRRFILPLQAPIEEYEIVNKLNNQLGRLEKRQIQLIQIALNI